MVEEKADGFPRFFDYDRFFFEYLEEAEENNRFGVAVKARNKGFSYKISSMLLRNFFLIPDSKNFAVTSKKDFLIRDGILTKAWKGLNFINEHTGWSKSFATDTLLRKCSGTKVKNA